MKAQKNKDLEIIVNKMDILIDYFDNKNDIDKVTGIVAAASRIVEEKEKLWNDVVKLTAKNESLKGELARYKVEVAFLNSKIKQKEDETIKLKTEAEEHCISTLEGDQQLTKIL